MSWQYNSRVFAQTGAAAHADQRILALADNNVFRGYAIAATSSRCGEIVFNTAMTGYQEILTTPSSLFEASTGPHDTENLFVRLVVAMREWRV